MRHGGGSSFVEMRAGGRAPRRQRGGGGRFYCLDTSTSASTASSTATSTTRSTNTTGPHAAVAALHADIVLSCGVPPASRNLQQGRYRGGWGGDGVEGWRRGVIGCAVRVQLYTVCALANPTLPPCLAVRARLRPDNSPASGALLRGLGSTGTRARWHRARGVQEDQRRASRDVARGNHPLVDCSGRGSCPPARISATRQWRGVQAG